MQLEQFVLLWPSKPVIHNVSELPRTSRIETSIDQQMDLIIIEMDLIIIENEILPEKIYLELSTSAEHQVSSQILPLSLVEGWISKLLYPSADCQC